MPRLLCISARFLGQGVQERHVAATVATIVDRVALPWEMALRPAGQYSGGEQSQHVLHGACRIVRDKTYLCSA